MPVREIVKFPDPILKETSKLVDPYDKESLEINALITDLKDTVNAPYGKLRAAGLSAPQIGVSKRVVILNHGVHKNVIMINPVLLTAAGRIKHDEMCLSYPGMKRRRLRRQCIRVEYFNEKFKLTTQTFFGIEAVIVQHELDHLDGKGLDDE